MERFRSPADGGYADTERLSAGATLVPEALGAPDVPLAELLDFALGR